MLRRMLAITLLIAFGSPLALSLFAATADPEAALPACCRTHGAHHCAMTHRALAESEGAALQAPPCSDYPTPTTPARRATGSLAAPLPLTAELLQTPVLLPSGPHRIRSVVASANLNRGPPARPA